MTIAELVAAPRRRAGFVAMHGRPPLRSAPWARLRPRAAARRGGRPRALFQTSLDECDAPAAVRAILALEETIQAWSHDTDQSDALAQARSALRAAIVCLGEMAVAGIRDPAEVVRPVRRRAASRTGPHAGAREWAAADAIRDRFLAAGVDSTTPPTAPPGIAPGRTGGAEGARRAGPRGQLTAPRRPPFATRLQRGTTYLP